MLGLGLLQTEREFSICNFYGSFYLLLRDGSRVLVIFKLRAGFTGVGGGLEGVLETACRENMFFALTAAAPPPTIVACAAEEDLPSRRRGCGLFDNNNKDDEDEEEDGGSWTINRDPSRTDRGALSMERGSAAATASSGAV